jgi:hypothetical protein
MHPIAGKSGGRHDLCVRFGRSGRGATEVGH